MQIVYIYVCTFAYASFRYYLEKSTRRTSLKFEEKGARVNTREPILHFMFVGLVTDVS